MASFSPKTLKRLSRTTASTAPPSATTRYALPISIAGGNSDTNYCEPQDYDHSYYFISSFGADHVKHAAKYLSLL